MKKYTLLLVLFALLFGCTKNSEDYYDEATKLMKNKEYAKAVELYNKSCDMGYGKSCSSLAFLYEKGTVVEKNLEKADGLNIKACNNGYAASCFYTARLKSDNITEFSLYMDKSCSLELPAGCLALGNVYLNGYNESMILIEKDIEKGISYIKKACEIDNKFCADMADIYISGSDTPQNYEEAVKYYEKAVAVYEKECKEYDDNNTSCLNINIIKSKYSHE